MPRSDDESVTPKRSASRRTESATPAPDAVEAAPAEPSARKGKHHKHEGKVASPPSKERTEPLNFRVAPDFRRAFKRAAAVQDCKKVELLERIFAEWSERNPA
ncbi:conserved protein of unknown function [Rhodovastum atsumiense]|uniref:Uncharacterized protein n=1 Tax=Rhodovastum atsumiense TaxID=504468 RepID=A0A5M6IZA6_9PROT|nr:hypothetical protein [Rhodovastum atsumiense]KAA5613289.1 hypothetical protein F1189_06255 [Rhodovastum atsumiense]CAH2600546.1 conserved protein of unknown function [Rhodovastum atsumiense]